MVNMRAVHIIVSEYLHRTVRDVVVVTAALVLVREVSVLVRGVVAVPAF